MNEWPIFAGATGCVKDQAFGRRKAEELIDTTKVS